MPVQRPIPVWMGGTADVVLRRVARLADGYLPQFDLGPEAEETLERLDGYIEDAGRDPDEVGIHGRLELAGRNPEAWVQDVREWSDLGADYLSLNPMGAGRDPDEHVALLGRFADAARDAGIDLK